MEQQVTSHGNKTDFRGPLIHDVTQTRSASQNNQASCATGGHRQDGHLTAVYVKLLLILCPTLAHSYHSGQFKANQHLPVLFT